MSSFRSALQISLSQSSNVRRQFNLECRRKLVKVNGGQKPLVVSCLSVEAREAPVSVGLGKIKEVMEAEKKLLVGTYARAPVVLASGKGCKLYDVEGKEYLDMGSGIAVNALGHGDPDWVKAVVDQANVLTHISNMYYNVPQFYNYS